MNSLTVTIGDVSHEVRTTPGDLVRLERQFNISAAELEAHARLEHMMFLAYVGLKREGKYEHDFETFLDSVGDTEPAPK